MSFLPWRVATIEKRSCYRTIYRGQAGPMPKVGDPVEIVILNDFSPEGIGYQSGVVTAINQTLRTYSVTAVEAHQVSLFDMEGEKI